MSRGVGEVRLYPPQTVVIAKQDVDEDGDEDTVYGLPSVQIGCSVKSKKSAEGLLLSLPSDDLKQLCRGVKRGQSKALTCIASPQADRAEIKPDDTKLTTQERACLAGMSALGYFKGSIAIPGGPSTDPEWRYPVIFEGGSRFQIGQEVKAVVQHYYDEEGGMRGRVADLRVIWKAPYGMVFRSLTELLEGAAFGGVALFDQMTAIRNVVRLFEEEPGSPAYNKSLSQLIDLAKKYRSIYFQDFRDQDFDLIREELPKFIAFVKTQANVTHLVEFAPEVPRVLDFNLVMQPSRRASKMSLIIIRFRELKEAYLKHRKEAEPAYLSVLHRKYGHFSLVVGIKDKEGDGEITYFDYYNVRLVELMDKDDEGE